MKNFENPFAVLTDRVATEVLLEFRNPVFVITKNQMVRRDIVLFRQMAEYNGITVFLSITSLNPELLAVLPV